MKRSLRVLVAALIVLAAPARAEVVNGELKKAKLEKLGSSPTGTEARIYWDTTQKKAQIYDGTNWTAIGSSVFSPLAYAQTKTAVVAIGSVGNNSAGHVIDTNDFPVTTGKIAFWNFSSSATTDNSGALSCSSGTAACTLTATGTPTFTTTNVVGSTNAAMTLSGTGQWMKSTDAFFNPGASKSWAMGGWFKPTNWATSAVLMSNYTSGTDRGPYIQTTGAGISCNATNTATGVDFSLGTTSALTAGWHHVVMVYDFAATTFRCFLDGKIVGQMTASNTRAMTASNFQVGSDSLGADLVTGGMEDVFYHNPNSGAAGAALTPDDVRKLYAARLTHGLLVAPEKQLWTGNWYRSDSAVANQLSSSWLVSKDTTRLWYDFSDIAAGAFIDFGAQNMNTSGTVVPIGLYDSGQLTAAPSTTIAHGLGIIPEVVTLQYELSATAGRPMTLNEGDYCDWDNTNLYCDWTGLTVDATHRLRIKAAIAQSSVAVPNATTALGGLVSTGTQSFAGAKTFTGQIVPSGGFGAGGDAVPGTTRGLVPANGLPGNITGSAVPAGAIGEQIVFTPRACSANVSNYTSNASALASLTTGVWAIYAFMTIANQTSLTYAAAFVATNTANDSSGPINSIATVPANATLTVRYPLLVGYYIAPVGAATPIYAKALSVGASTTVTVDGFAIRAG